MKQEYPKRLSNGRWRDENGNSHSTLKQACRGQAVAEGAYTDEEVRSMAKEIEILILRKLS